MNNKKFPLVNKELLEHLETTFPDRMPDLELGGLETIRYKQGQISVIRLLRKQFTNQTTKTLENY